MKNKVGREIPPALLTAGRRSFQGPEASAVFLQKVGPKVEIAPAQHESKVVESLREAICRVGLKDGATISFHHHFRDGDYIVNMVMDEIAAMGIRNITIAASSLGTAHDPVAEYIEKGVVTGLQTSGIRGRVGEVVSEGRLKTPAIIRSHGGRVRALESGELKIDVAFIGAPSSDCCGNARGQGGKNNCGVLSYAMADAKYADRVVVITDTLVKYPNFPPSIEEIDVDCVVLVDAIGDGEKIASQATRYTKNPRDLMMAEHCAKVIEAMPWFRDGFSFQTGAGGPSLAANRYIEALLRKYGYRIGWIIGGICKSAVDMLEEGLVEMILDAQDFDVPALQSVHRNPRHFEISTAQYASPSNKGAFVNRLDFVILAALEVDTDFNVNVVTGSDGILRGAPGGHPDAAAGAKCTIIVAPLVRGRIPTICDHVVTVTTPGDCVDVVVTDYGIAVNPLRQDIQKALDAAGIETVTIESLRNQAQKMVGKPQNVSFTDRLVAIVEARDGSILDVVYQVAKRETIRWSNRQ